MSTGVYIFVHTNKEPHIVSPETNFLFIRAFSAGLLLQAALIRLDDITKQSAFNSPRSCTGITVSPFIS